MLSLQVDIDTRLSELWARVWAPGFPLAAALDDETTVDAIGGVMRTAYARGYQDALDDDAGGARNALAQDNGYSRRV